MKIFINTLKIVPILLLGLLLNSCEEGLTYQKINDLFQPRYVLTEPVVEGNSIALVWYEVNDASSYTVELHQDVYYNSLFATYTTTDPFIKMDDIPYATRFYIRVKSNHPANPIYDSEWAYTNALTATRPPFESILQKVSRTDITDTTVVVRWTISAQSPVDSISLVPATDKTIPSLGRPLTSEEISQGFCEIDGLAKNTLYDVDIYDRTKPRKYDQPYNKVTFRTAGPSAGSIIIGPDDDLSAILLANNDNNEISEGTEYYLPAGSYYKLTTFTIKKGFKLVGATDGAKPRLEMGGNWNIAEAVYLSTLEFANIELFQTIDAGYFFNSGNSWNIEEIIMFNCTFKHFKRGFWRHQGTNKYKRIGRLEMENCMLDECGGHTGPYGTFAINSGGADNIENAIFRNCTFMRDHYGTTDKTKNMRNLFDYSQSTYPIHLEYQNITLYDYCYNQRLINIPAAEGSTLIFEKVLIASACGNIYSIAANTSKEFSSNYVTTDYLVGPSSIDGTALELSAAELFANPENGNLTIKDSSSPIVLNGVGDTRWLPKN
jgi:hypothetical protein